MSPWGAVIAALIAGFIAFIGMVIAKENKVSEFRQEWIKDLRGEIAKLFSLYGSIKKDSELDPNEIKKKKNELNEVIASILLHLNQSKKSQNEEKLLADITNLTKKTHEGETNLSELFNELTMSSHAVLKEEWERVKKGEKGYVTIKEMLIAFFVFSISALLISMLIFLMIQCGILSKGLLN